MNTTQKGKHSELLVLARLAKDGVTVAIPFGGQSGWDFLVETQSGWQKWQVKTAYHRPQRGSIYVDCIRGGDPRGKRRGSRQYHKGDFDVLVAVFPESAEMWKVPAHIAIGRRCIVVGKDYEW